MQVLTYIANTEMCMTYFLFLICSEDRNLTICYVRPHHKLLLPLRNRHPEIDSSGQGIAGRPNVRTRTCRELDMIS